MLTKRNLIVTVCLGMCSARALAFDIYTELPPELANYDVTSLVHIASTAQAQAVRQRVIEYFWPDGKLPTAKLPTAENVYTGEGLLPRELQSIQKAAVRRVERLDVNVDFDYHHYSFLLHPATAAQSKRFIVIHQGHQGGLADGIGPLTNRVLEKGFAVLLMQMPFTGWNTCNTFKTPTRTVTIKQPHYVGHNELFKVMADEGGRLFRFFIEPVTVGVNYFIAQNPDYRDITMIGLSGGAWTTHLAAAIDSRISLSIPVAGSYPLFLRKYYRGSTGDAEQILPALYKDRASWLDLYILGGDGPRRRQIQLLNQYDTCCFYGVGSNTYKDAVSRIAKGLGGQWECVLDSSHKSHQISAWAIEKVIEPALDK